MWRRVDPCGPSGGGQAQEAGGLCPPRFFRPPLWGEEMGENLGIIVLGIPLVAITALVKLGNVSTVTVGSIFSSPFIPTGMHTQAIFIIIPFLLSISVSYDAYMRYQSAKSASVAKCGCILAGLVVSALLAAAMSTGNCLLVSSLFLSASRVPSTVSSISILACLSPMPFPPLSL